MDLFAEVVASWFLLLTIASFAVKPADKYGIPHSVILVFIGMGLGILSFITPYFNFLINFKLSPELIFFVFLPTLIFESAFQIPLKKIIDDIVPISILSILSYLFSSILIATGLYFLLGIFSIEIPFLITLLFGVIISATDPVAVLAIFKKMGVPPRLTRFFESESLFNDGTAWASFVILLEIITYHEGHFSTSDIPIMIIKFLVMILGGIGFGILMGNIFTKLIGKARGDEVVQLTLTLIMAHVTFLLADLSKSLLIIGDTQFEISAIISTVIASIILGNKGIQKFSPSIRVHMKTFWEHFAFIANSFIFLIIGIMTIQILNPHKLSQLWVPILLGIIVTVLSRILSVFIPLNLYNKCITKKTYQHIPQKWISIISWASLRGVIAIAALLIIPDNIHVPGWNMNISEKEFLVYMVISCILFTMFIKALPLHIVIQKMQLNILSDRERVEELEARMLVNLTIIQRLEELSSKGYISADTGKKLRKMYNKSQLKNRASIAKIFQEQLSHDEVNGIMRLHALSIEEKTLQRLLDSGELDEKVFWRLEEKLSHQRERIEKNQEQIQGSFKLPHSIPKNELDTRYQMARARVVVTSKVLRRLEELQGANLQIPNKILEDMIKQYTRLNREAYHVQLFIAKKHPQKIKKLEYRIFTQFLVWFEDSLLSRLHEKSIVQDRVFSHLSKNNND